MIEVNYKELDIISSFDKRIRFCKNNLKRLSAGSSRVVYDLRNGNILKLAKHKLGLKQNEHEIYVSKYRYMEHLFGKVIDSSEEKLFLIMKKYETLNKVSFKKYSSIDWKDFCDFINNIPCRYNDNGNDLLPGTKESAYYEKLMNEFPNNKLYNFLNSLYNLICNTDIPPYDFCKIDSWGYDSDEDKIVLIDYGLSEEIVNRKYK